jgi:alkaline phosphatase D
MEHRTREKLDPSGAVRPTRVGEPECEREGIMRRGILCVFLLIGLAGLVAAETSDDVFPYSVASGDPRATSVVLWTFLDSPLEISPLTVDLEVDTMMEFTDPVVTRTLTVDEEYGGAVKVLVDGLEPYTTYYYRFTHDDWTSRVGRTKTAPTPDMDVDARFAVVYCQDYIDRYYNAYATLLAEEEDTIDFVVHLGDIIYEHTGGSSDLPAQTDRTIEFEDLEGVISYGEFLAAGSLDNYRTIYKTFRTDPVYQQVHERWPMMVIWDDHEYSNDHWGATGTYTNGRVDEYDEDRRRNAEQAFFEWVPIEAGIGDDGVLEIDASMLYPNTRIYRDFLYGANLHVVLTDWRTYRPDNLVPEDAFPGAIAIEQEDLVEVLQFVGLDFEEVKGTFDPYIDMGYVGSLLPIFHQTTTLIVASAYMGENPGLDLFQAVKLAEAALDGPVSTTYLNGAFAAAGASPPFTPDITAGLPRGLSYLFIGKQEIYASAGVRNTVFHDAFNLYAIQRYLETGGAAQNVYGGEQTAWMQGALLASPATWKVLGQSVVMAPQVIDFTNPLIAAGLPPDFPDLLRVRLGLNVEDFNGFPQARLELLGLLDVVPNSVVISGDIHGTFVIDHTNGVYEFTPPSISSTTFGQFVLRGAEEILGPDGGAAELAAQLDALMQISALDDELVSPSDFLYSNQWVHGFMVMEATPEALYTTIYQIPYEYVGTSFYHDPEALDELVEVLEFTLMDGVLEQMR